ncbi:RagB/SusD family nutrient uptake outer membrane protein [Rhizosphaericola mali]|uniref:RagB/SusD family nutrient uptake outer membrane protein n=1 Tax=Rhizosphaericola mali TaxID=2545455 RepID=A0A5P2G3J4_9BACT|nr:RagB/SusD family nutrient uptake outer membrane protein [Rhizosphaericola mali]QES90386.1 RagB/SusD family nutrient uptake outer membrane protein [Rhizosphaericola mali]
MSFRKINILLSSSFAALIGLTSCSKSFIERNPVDPVTEPEAITNASGMQDALVGVYASYRATSFYGEDLPIIGDVSADNSFIAASNSGYYLTPYQYTFVNNDANYTEMWKQGYNIILNANKIINSSPTGDAETIGEIRSQAYALRALAYFKLINIYARPYTDNPSDSGISITLTDSSAAKPSRNTIKQVYTQIISDYKAALDSAPAYDNSVTLSQYAIEGLLSKAYLYMGDYTNALTQAEDVINNSGFSLVPSSSYASFWSNAAVQQNQQEVMFEIDANSINNNGYDDFAGQYANGYSQIFCDSALYASYSSTDVRRSVLESDTTLVAGKPRIVVHVNKFPNAANADRDNIKVIRLAEVYLIAAEAAYRTGDQATALQYLNALAQTRDPQLTAYASSGTQLLTDIINERRKELAFEGDRLYDLNRLQQTLYRNGTPYKGLPLTSQYITIAYDFYKRIAPIPLDELNANSNMTQNPGY